MRIDGRFDLTYCSNIHAGESWADVSAVLRRSLPRVRGMLGAEGPFGIGLRLSAAAAQDLDAPDALDAFRQFLRDGDYYVPTINGFPYGAFHGTRVKERVYLPDWRSLERVDYTSRLARILAALSADAGARHASISTVPGAFRAALASAADVGAMGMNVLRYAAYAKRLHDETGITIALAIEPEPACHMETSDEALAFVTSQLLPAHARAAAAKESGVLLREEEVLTYVGLCLDACHMAVEFESAASALDAARSAGVAIYKTQLSSAVRVVPEPGGSGAAGVLERFAEDTYLHQVVTSGPEGLRRFSDLPDALASADVSDRDEWRVHFHVPVFLAAMSGFDTTQAYLANVIALLRQTGACRCLEVETYTWDVLPPEYRTTDVCTAIARELDWVREQLTDGFAHA